jgi:DNA segregation ATPase FtsK/SpoIIIE, S-DNA-T family
MNDLTPKFFQDEDELYEDAARIVREWGRASTSLLQRRLRIGYARASYLIDLMKEKGLVDRDGVIVKKQ